MAGHTVPSSHLLGEHLLQLLPLTANWVNLPQLRLFVDDTNRRIGLILIMHKNEHLLRY